MKIFAVNSSPTASRGMTQRLLELVLEGARQAGAEVEQVFLQGRRIAPCLGCLNCWVRHPGRCVQKDDMDELRPKVAAADVFLLATPVYVDGMCAQAKIFLDRLIPLIDPHFTLVDGHCRHRMLSEKMPDLALVSVCGFYELDNFEPLVEHLRRAAKNLGGRFLGAVLRPASRLLTLKDSMPDQVEQIEQAARRAGRELVEKGAFSPETLEEVARQFFPKEIYVDGANLFWDRCIKKGRFPPD